MSPDHRVIHDGERVVLDIIIFHRPNGIFTVFDVGANVGDYIEEVFKREPGATVIAFEPQPEAAAEVALRFPATVVELFALGKDDKSIDLSRDRAKSYHASAYRTSHKVLGSFEQKLRVKQHRLDTYCALHMIRSIDLMKVDVEGAEMDVLLGAGNMITAGRIKIIQFEYNDNAPLAGNGFIDFWMFFHEHGYRLFREHERSIEEITEYSEQDEHHYPDRNYLAVHKSVDWWPY